MEYYIVILLFICHVTEAFEETQTLSTLDMDQILPNETNEFIPEDYLKNMKPPTLFGEPMEVGFSMRIYVISSIDVNSMEFSIDMYVKQEWQDTRITIPDEIYESDRDAVHLSSNIFQNLWQPDLYFLNSRTEDKPTMAHKYASVVLFKNKTIRFLQKVHAVVACQMEFSSFPMDTQICPISVESFAHTNNLMKLKWIGHGVSLNPEIKHQQYRILPVNFKESDEYTTEKNGNFSRLIVYFAFERHIGHHLIQIYAPSTLIVALSWFSFWLDFDAIPGRVTLLVTCQLSLVTMFSDLRDETPPVDYIKALDIWMAGCMISVFGAVAEFVIAKVFFGKYNDHKKKEQEQKIPDVRVSIASEFMDPNSSQYKNDFCYNTTKQKSPHLYWITGEGKEKVLWRELDRTSRYFFPLVFFVFATIYWTMMIYGREHFRRLQDFI
ncbi:glycine receptor subunit alphaZ1-like [Diabrotica undecimpunctata]|uniref:glycine receptor subunit alphaZ1-like n=1 Tax=Diabrotica undecimpunctata TaxID=50387 RepID=UPI003B6345A9